MQKPNFIIIGAQKSGTTSLYKYLTKHPQILSATKKEVHFFDLNFNKGMNWYYSHFPKTEIQNQTITGEASPYYIFHPHVPQRISQFLPDIKLIVLLRNPVDRAVSHYYHNCRFGKSREPLSFEQAIQQESSRIETEKNKIMADENYKSLPYRYYTYLSRGIYIEQLIRWMKFFPRKSFLILKSEELWENPEQKMKQVWNFLGVTSRPQEVYEKYNYTRHKKGISAAKRMMLTEYFQPYNQRLEEYLGQKFNWDNTAAKKSENQENKSLNTVAITQQASQKNQDKLSVIKIQQGERSPSQKKNQKVSRKIDFKYLVVGTARSGTKFMAYAFRSVGIKCGHESFFGAPSRKQLYLTEQVVGQRMLNHPELEADSSWLAVPFLKTECVPKDVSIIHLTRHPQKVIESLIAIGFFRRNHCFYTNYALLNTPQIKSSDSELTKCCKWYLYWHNKIEQSGRQLIHYRLEDTPAILFNRLNINYDGYKIFDDIKTNTRDSENRRHINLIEEIEEPNLLKQIIEIAQRYGYSITEEIERSRSLKKNQQENIIKLDKYEKNLQKFASKLAKIKDELL
ncbi:MAG: sulfotransferase domain-containing protein [Trichodesmium sp. MAG_R03]|nr:sulfotransferase domain-containing protein [Trichodesmium sp. MAG_R03]